MSAQTRGFGLQVRLLALVLVPAVLLAGAAITVSGAKRHSASLASDVQGHVEQLGQLVDLTESLLLARTPVEVEVRAKDLGLDGTEAIDLLDLEGRDLRRSGDMSQVRADLRRMVPSLRPFSDGRVRALGVAAAKGATAEQLDEFQQLELLVEATWNQQIATLRRQVVELGDVQVAQLLDDLDAASTAGSATASQLTGLAAFWFSTLAGPTPTQAARADAARVDLGIQETRFDRAIDQLANSPVADASQQALAIAALRERGLFGVAIADAAAGRPPAPFVDGVDIDLIVATFSDSFRELDPLLALVSGRSLRLEQAAAELADRSSSAADATLAALAVVAVLISLLSIAVAASFERPLLRLITATRRVGSGDLSGDLLTGGGPPEVAAASAAFNDVVVNLRLLEGKVRALAESNLDDPRLEQPLPGELGSALDASVEVLAASIADRAELQERLAHQATHDSLTGIANRAGALTALTAAVARAHRHGTTVAVAFLDLDGFKAVNDALGHAAGDEVLQEVAARLLAQARTGDFCARLGGDEFIVIAEQMTSARDALVMGRRIAHAISRPMQVGGLPVQVGASVGIALSDDPTEPPGALLDRADVSAYRAKRSGTGVEVCRGDLREGEPDDIPAIERADLPEPGT